MSGDNDVTFIVNYEGKFEITNGATCYVGGSIHCLQTAPQSLFSGLVSAEIVDMYKQRVWHKLPFEDMNDLKVLCDGSANFQRMCNAAPWNRLVEVYMEHENAHSEDEDNANRSGENAGCNLGGIESNEDNTGQERVEAIVSEFLDEAEDNEALRDTPPNSEDEEEDLGGEYVRWRRGSGQLKIMQVFDSINEFKEAVLEYALLGGWNVKYTRWGSEISEARCAVHGDISCGWRIYCSFEKTVQKYMVKTYQEEHSCTRDGYCKLLTDQVIAELLINEIRNDMGMMPRVIQDIIQDRYQLTVTHDIARKTRKKALELINDEFDQQFARMKEYKAQILISNPGSTVDLVTRPKEDGVELFDKFYVCFKALKTIWKAHCRPIFGIDGCFLKLSSAGQLLAAVGRDANNQIYPIAWGVVEVESTDNWKWFIQLLKTDLNLHDGAGFTLISDKQKGLLKAVEEELPMVEHRMCARHIYGNIKKLHPNKPQFKKLFWEVSNSFNEGDYKVALKKVEAFDVEVYNDLMARDPTTCCRAFFKTTSSCEDALNNFSESYNSGLEKARSLPLIEMLETVRRQAMIRIELRKNKLTRYKAKYSLKVASTIAAEEKQRSKWCKKRTPGPNGVSEVSERSTSYSVNIEKRTCSCRMWDVTEIPCRHALKVFVDKKLNAEDYVADCYLTATWKMQYSDSISPVEGMKFWQEDISSQLEPPPRNTDKGRKKKPQKRKKEIYESPTKGKKVSKHLKVIHCYRCGLAGHNILHCPNYGAPNKPRKVYPRKKKQSKQAASMTMDYNEGPSQPTQSSRVHE